MFLGVSQCTHRKEDRVTAGVLQLKCYCRLLLLHNLLPGGGESREGERTLLENCFCRPCVVCSGDLCAVPQAANDSVPPWYSETSCREGEETEKTDKGDAQSPTAKTESQWLEKSRVEKDGGGENKARKTLGKGAAGMGNMEVLTAREIDC